MQELCLPLKPTTDESRWQVFQFIRSINDPTIVLTLNVHRLLTKHWNSCGQLKSVKSKPHQVTPHFKRIDKRRITVITISLYLKINENGGRFKFT